MAQNIDPVVPPSEFYALNQNAKWCQFCVAALSNAKYLTDNIFNAHYIYKNFLNLQKCRSDTTISGKIFCKFV